MGWVLRILRGSSRHARSRQSEAAGWTNGAAQLGGGLRDLQQSEGLGGVARVVSGAGLLGSES